MAIFLSVFSGSRKPLVDRDYLGYTRWIDNIGSSFSDVVAQGKDIGFILIYKFSSIFSDGYILFFTLVSFLSILFKLKFSSTIFNGKFTLLIFFLIFSRFYLLHDFTQVRAGLAIALASYSIVFLMKYHKKKTYLFVLLAGLIHLSSLLLIVLYVIYGFIKNKRMFFFLLLALPLLGIFMGEGIKNILPLINSDRLNVYLNGEYMTEKVSLLTSYYLVRFFVFYFLMFICYSKLISEYKIYLFFTSLSLFFHAALSWNDAIALRTVEVIGLFDMVTLILPLMCLNNRSRLLYGFLIIIVGILFYMSTMKIVNPYESYIF
ncbi:EpsG family protein [Limnobaculum parvum]|nr:EpsG family protein [Limnobaculum parvum]